MASAFGHFASAWAVSNIIKLKEPISKWAIFVGMICAALPDIDVLAFKFGIPYEDMWGHRGITHSFFAAFLVAFVLCLFMAKTKKTRFVLFIYFFLCTALHGVLDAMTTGGEGIAFFAPFDNTRYFLPWQFIKVSPLGFKKFFSEWGMKVILSEMIWIGIPTLGTYIIYRVFKQKQSTEVS